jgi:hypothetical protein
MFDDNFDTVQAPDPNTKQSDTMDRLFQTNRYIYDDPFGNEHTYLFTSGGANIHPDNLTPTIETCQTSFTTTLSSETQQHISADNTTRHKSILSMQDLMILHTNHIYPQSPKDDFKAYKHLHGIDMQIHSIPKSPQQKAQEMELHMSQAGLIDPVTESAHIPKGRLKITPTPATAILHADTEGLDRQESWNYPSVIGQLSYLAQNS